MFGGTLKILIRPADQGPTLSQSLITANLKMKKHTFLRSSNELPNLVAVGGMAPLHVAP
jgi:hypothetical protein